LAGLQAILQSLWAAGARWSRAWQQLLAPLPGLRHYPRLCLTITAAILRLRSSVCDYWWWSLIPTKFALVYCIYEQAFAPIWFRLCSGCSKTVGCWRSRRAGVSSVTSGAARKVRCRDSSIFFLARVLLLQTQITPTCLNNLRHWFGDSLALTGEIPAGDPSNSTTNLRLLIFKQYRCGKPPKTEQATTSGTLKPPKVMSRNNHQQTKHRSVIIPAIRSPWRSIVWQRC